MARHDRLRAFIGRSLCRAVHVSDRRGGEQVDKHRDRHVGVVVTVDADVRELVLGPCDGHDMPAVDAAGRVRRVPPQLELADADTHTLDARWAGAA